MKQTTKKPVFFSHLDPLEGHAEVDIYRDLKRDDR